MDPGEFTADLQVAGPGSSIDLVLENRREWFASLFGGQRDLVLASVGLDHDAQAVLFGDAADVTVALGESQRLDDVADRLVEIRDRGQILDVGEGASGETGHELLACSQ